MSGIMPSGSLKRKKTAAIPADNSLVPLEAKADDDDDEDDDNRPVTLGPKIAKRSERVYLRGESCRCCDKFFSSMNHDNPVQKYSRHRHEVPRATTPPGFWGLDITSPEAKRTKKIHSSRLNLQSKSTKEKEEVKDEKIEDTNGKEKENNLIDQLKTNVQEEEVPIKEVNQI